jgi:hypothetical protein
MMKKLQVEKNNKTVANFEKKIYFRRLKTST